MLILNLFVVAALFVRTVVSDASRKLIAGGRIAIDRYPYFTRIPQVVPPVGGNNFCGGSLIAPDMVLTSAMCLNIQQDVVTVGWRRGVFNETAVARTFVHPTFNGNQNNLDYAFAIIQLASNSDLGIVELNSDPAVPDNTTELGVLGSGFDTTLNEADVFAITDEECSASQNLAGFPIQVESSQMCAGDGESGFCVDDWGGPLVQRAENTTTAVDVQVGVAAWALCGDIDPASPGIYLRVSDAYEWIRSTVCVNSNAPRPIYLDCDNAIDPDILPPPAHVPPPSPITFRYDIFNDFYLFEAGVAIEKITGVNNVEIVEYVVPGSLLVRSTLTPNMTLSNRVALESDALYSFVLVDGQGDGLSTTRGQETLSDAIELYLQNANGNFQRIEGQVGGFTYRTSHIFYASLGTVSNAFFKRTTYPGGHVANARIILDDYPWEIGMELRASDGTLIWYSPPRFYDVPGATVQERISLPDVTDRYTLTIGDTNGNGLGSDGTGVTLTDRTGNELGSTSFDTGSSAAITFEYVPELVNTAVPTVSPTEPPTPTPTVLPEGETRSPVVPTEQPTSSPVTNTTPSTPTPLSSSLHVKVSTSAVFLLILSAIFF